MVKFLSSFGSKIIYCIKIGRNNLFINLSKNQKRFINDISKKNSKKAKIESDSFVIIEGSLIAGGPNYLYRLASIADSISQKLQVKPLVVFNSYAFVRRQEVLLCRAFGINDFVYTKNFFSTIPIVIKSYFDAIQIFKKCMSNDTSISSLKYKNILIGDCIYDDIIRRENDVFSVINIVPKYFRYFYNTIYYVNIYAKILKNINCQYVIVTHTQYGEYSLLARVAFDTNISIFETTDMCLLFSDVKKKNNDISYPTYHGTLRSIIRDMMQKSTFTKEEEHIALQNLLKRHNGDSQQYDLRLAYNNKIIYTDQDLRKKLKIRNNKPFVFVLAHVFSDAPLTIGDGMLFDDYYQWLMSTIEEAVKNKEVNWVIKPHPASIVYNEEGVVKDKISVINAENIYLCPDDFNTASIQNIALSIVTARGTAGLEYSCLGIPVLVAGKSFYSGFGFTIEPQTVNEYYQCLNSIAQIKKLTDEQIRNALWVYSIFVNYSSLENDPIITSELLGHVWGVNGYSKNIDLAYATILKNLQHSSLDSWQHLKLVEAFLKS